jgi:CTP:molybdopterin cytidylyltransferase MocA
MKKILVVLAAGMGSRFGGVKQVARVGKNGETLLDYSLQDAIKYGFTDVMYIVREAIQQEICDIIADTYKLLLHTSLVFQEIPE